MIAPLFHTMALTSLFSWIIAYALMTRRGIKDRSYGMPVTALCVNLSWEFHFTFLTDLPVKSCIPKALLLLFDLGVLYTYLRYGRDDFDWPILKKRFLSFFALILAVSFTLHYFFVTSFHDRGGMVTLWVMILYSTLLIVMLIRRNSVKGQSLYIGFFILTGDISGYVIMLYLQQHVQKEIPLAWIHASLTYVLLAHISYILLYYHVARRDGINPWTRL